MPIPPIIITAGAAAAKAALIALAGAAVKAGEKSLQEKNKQK